MNDQPTALRLADELRHVAKYSDSEHWDTFDAVAAELRRLHEVNAELLDALKLAIRAHGVLLTSDPPQEAWKTYGVEAKARAAIKTVEGEKA